LLRNLDFKGLRVRWQNEFGRPAPEHLTRYLLFRIIAYRLQADHLGDLDAETLKVLMQAAGKEDPASAVSKKPGSARPETFCSATRNCPGAGMGADISSGDGDAGWLCMEWQNLRQPESGRLGHHRDQVERPPLLGLAGQAAPDQCWGSE
jgi:hypothetical protein